MSSPPTTHSSLTNQSDQLIRSGTENDETAYPLSAMQLGMLFHLIQSSHAGVDIEQIICATSDPLDLSAFDRAWQKLLARHAILRTSFLWQQLDEPRQQVHPHVDLPLKSHDCRHLSSEQQQQRLNSYLQSDRLQGFSPSVAPLMRLVVFRWTEVEYTWVWTFHHILLDGRSIHLILQEFCAFYQAFSDTQAFDLPPPLPYRRYIAWLCQQTFSAALPYWKKHLQGFAAPTPLPPGYPQSPLTGHAQAQICLSVQATEALKVTAKALDITPNTIIQGVWGLLLNYYSDQEDVVFGCIRACRHSTVEGSEGMVGLFINTVPVRVRITPELALAAYLRQLREQHLAVRPYEHTPLTTIQQCSEVPARKPLFESLVVFEHANHFESLHHDYPLWTFRMLEQPSYPLVLLCNLGAQTELKLCYAQSRFDQETIARLLQQLAFAIEQIIAHPEQPIQQLSFLTELEQRHILQDWNKPQIAYPEQLRLHDLFETQVERNPDAIALVFQEQRLSYRELNCQSNQLAHFLQGQGVKAEVTVGVCLERSVAMLVALLAIVKAGGAYVPLDPTYPQERLAYITNDAAVRLILTQGELEANLPKATVKTLCLEKEAPLLAAQPVSNPESETNATNLAYIIYTSGSTGKPKGVLLHHQGAVNTIWAINRRFSVAEGDRVLAVCPLSFDLSVYDIFGVLGGGGTVVLPPSSLAPNLQEWLRLMHREEVTLWNSSPLVMQLLVGSLQTQRQQLPASLRLVLLSGDWIPLSLPSAIRQLAPSADQLAVISLGGATEASIWSIAYEINAVSDQWRSIPYGKPLDNQWVYVLDEQQALVGVGKSGELYIGGDGVAQGYLNQPELNAKRFIADPFSPDQGRKLYRTGDLGRYLPDGNIELLGRIDHQIKLRGIRVELGEIESVFLQHPGVQDCVVILRNDASSNPRLVGYVVRSPDVQPLQAQQLKADLRALLKQKLPSYMVPSAIVWIEQLPLTENGKLDRHKLAALESLAGEQACHEPWTAPRDPLEAGLAELWQKTLGVPRISIHDNFFDLGGNSLVALQLWSKWVGASHQGASVALLFQYPTIAALAEQLRQERTRLCSSLVTLQAGKQQQKRPLFCIHVLGLGLRYYRSLLPYLDDDQTVYGLSTQLAGEQLTSNLVEDVARHYVEQMQQVQPQGPYLLLGFSFGGLVAYEMAQQLQAQGQTVALLGLLDTRSLVTTVATKAQGVVSQSITPLLQWTQNLAVGGLPGLVASLQWQRLKLAVRCFQSARLPMTPRLQEALYTMQNIRYGREYKPKPYAGQVTLFKAAQQFERVGWDLGWSQLALGGLHVHTIPGRHEKIFEEPNVQILGKKLDAVIKVIVPSTTATVGSVTAAGKNTTELHSDQKRR